MTTVIQPASGAGALYTQGGTGTTPGYSALDDRRLATAALQEGVYGTSTTVTAGGVSSVAAADFMVTQRGSGANMSVDINMPAGGMAFVQGDTLSGQGLYGVPVHSANINEALAAADATNPRVDQIILEIQDDSLDASGGDDARIRVLTGTATSGATLDNRSGAATLPGSALLLADVLVAANATTIANSAIRDRRKWARGAYARIPITSAVATTSLTMTEISSAVRVECSGAPIMLSLDADCTNDSISDGVVLGALFDGGSTYAICSYVTFSPADAYENGGFMTDVLLSAGSHTIAPGFNCVTGGEAHVATTTKGSFVIEEKLKTATTNAVVTSG